MRKVIFIQHRENNPGIKKIQTTLFVLLAVFFISVQSTSAALICKDSADISIDEWYPDENLNYKDRIIISTNKNSHHGIARGLFLFDIPQELTAEDVKSASIYLSLCSHCGGGKGGTVSFHALNEPFDEETDTWNSLEGGNWDESVSAQGIIPEGNEWNEAVDGSPPPGAEGIDITALFKHTLEKVRENGIVLKFSDEHQEPFTHQNIASKESTDPLDFAPYVLIRTYEDEDPCPAEVLLSGTHDELVVSLRSFRDQVLARTAAGRLAISMYYHCAPILSRILHLF